MWSMLHVCVFLLLTSLAVIAVVPVQCARVGSYVGYVGCVHSHRLYYGVVVCWWMICVVYNLSTQVAHAGGGTELVYGHVLAYNRMSVILQGLTTIHLHEANQYLSCIDGLCGKQEQSNYGKNCGLVPITPSNASSLRADCLLVNENTQSVCSMQFKSITEYNPARLHKGSHAYKATTDVLVITTATEELHALVSEYFVTNKPAVNVWVLMHNENIQHDTGESLVLQHAEWLETNQVSVDELYHRAPSLAHNMFKGEGEKDTSLVDAVLLTLKEAQGFIKGSEE